jgi:phosphate transport system ATP-binding protein
MLLGENKRNIQIETQHLNVSYEKHPVLKDVNIQIPAKQLTAIIGPSGCGKTTLLKSFNRLLDLREDVTITGKILVDGQNILHPKLNVPNIRKKMGLLSQKPYPLPMSIFTRSGIVE